MDEEIIVEFQLLDKGVVENIKTAFEEDEILESNAFTGAEIITIILAAGKDTIFKVLNFFTKHRESLKSASVKIGKDEVELSGYSIKEVEDFIKSGNVEKVMSAIKNKKHG